MVGKHSAPWWANTVHNGGQTQCTWCANTVHNGWQTQCTMVGKHSAQWWANTVQNGGQTQCIMVGKHSAPNIVCSFFKFDQFMMFLWVPEAFQFYLMVDQFVANKTPFDILTYFNESSFTFSTLFLLPILLGLTLNLSDLMVYTASNGQADVSRIFSFLFNLKLNIESRAHKCNIISIMK